MLNNSNIPSGDIFPIHPRNLSKIPEDTYATTLYKSTFPAPNNSKIHLVDPYYKTSIKSKSDYTSNTIPPIKLRNYKIR